jgi:hypothetical protein
LEYRAVQYRPSIVISDPSGVPTAIVEVKALNGADARTATRYMRNLLAHGVLPHARYVLLITPDAGYLWRSPETILSGSTPSLIFPMGSIMEQYLRWNGGHAPVRGFVLESIARQWLSDLADGVVGEDPATRSLREAGFLDAVRDGMVSDQARV